jgi:hypothetical protein
MRQNAPKVYRQCGDDEHGGYDKENNCGSFHPDCTGLNLVTVVVKLVQNHAMLHNELDAYGRIAYNYYEKGKKDSNCNINP